MLDFPLDEYQGRLDKLLQGMATAEMDAVLLTAAENLRYFTGLQSVVWSSGYSTPGVLVVAADGRVAMVSSVSSQGPIRATTWLEEEDMVTYGSGSGMARSYAKAIFAACQRLNVHAGRIGMEHGTGFRVNLQAGHYQALQQLLQGAGAQTADAAPLLWQLRMVKSPREVECIRKAVVVAERMFDAAFSGVQLGKSTEREIFGMMAATALENGCEDLLPMVVRYGLERMAQVNCPSSDVVVEAVPGAILHLDGGPCYKGYYADIIRQGVVGGLTPQQAEYEKYAIESMEAALAVVREGIPVSAVSSAADEVLEKYGLAEYNNSKGWTGHGIGLDVHEEPQLAAGNSCLLRAGMTLAVEPSLKVPGVGSFCNEQNILVTATGYELLSCSPLAMRVL